jgi:ABC-2 type transport system ATP-binding protein
MSASIIDVRHLSRRFGSTRALEDVTLDVPAGVVLGLVGGNGAGKTTLIRHLLGLLRAQSGLVRVFGLDPVTDPPGVLGRIGFLSEDRDLPLWMKVDELLSHTRAYYPGWDPVYAEELRQSFELAPRQSVKTLSRGQLARLGLLVALAHRPPLLILDEPSSGLDALVRRDILAAIIRTVADEGRTVLFSSHLLEEVERVADRLVMLHEGRVLLQGDLPTVLGGHVRLVFRFEQPLRELPPLPGVLAADGAGCEWSILCNGQQEQLVEAATAAGATLLDRQQPSLEDVFLARSQQSLAK